MAIYVGNKKIDISGIDKVYVGNNLVYSAELTELCFTAKQANSTVELYSYGSPSISDTAYSTDRETWITYTPRTTGAITLTNVGDKVYFRNNITGVFSSTNHLQFIMSGLIKASGNVNSMYTTTNFNDLTTLSYDYCYYKLFYNCTSLTTAPALPATSLKTECYEYMFYGCTSLTTAPALPATSLKTECYAYMFRGCTSLTTAPALPATTLTSYCYSSMFQGCTSLTTAPALPATTLAGSCYSNMFYDCTSLTTAPALPATTLTSYCYSSMFQGCTSLTTALALPATTLSTSCYSNMFRGCTSLTTAPALPATTLTSYCYYRMFYGCTSLIEAPTLSATTLTDYCYYQMFYGCTNIKLSTTQTEEYTNSYRIPTSGTGTVGTSSLDDMFYGTGGTFTGTPSINTTYYLKVPNYLCFTPTSAASNISLNITGTLDYTPAIQYSTDKTAWFDYTFGTLISVSYNGNCYFRAKKINSSFSKNLFNYISFSSSNNFKISGNLMSLIHNYILSSSIPNNYCFARIFENCSKLVDASELELGSTTLTYGCYSNMFYGCTSLITPPTLYATTLAGECYQSMFYGCTSLTTAPTLSVTTLASSCYSNMFRGCTSLTTSPALPATTLANECYYKMFYGCTSITTAPKLSATTLTDSCYAYMFYGCVLLKSTPNLPATTLDRYCYASMFYGCTNLTTISKLPATTLANSCYDSMFYGCSKIKLSATQTGDYIKEYRIPTSGEGTIASYSLYNMFANTGGTFTGTPEINTTYYIYEELTELCFTANTAGSKVELIRISSLGISGTAYSYDRETWITFEPSTTSGTNEITLADIGDKVYFRNNITANFSSTYYLKFVMSGSLESSGSVDSMYSATNFASLTTLNYSYCYYKLFYGCAALTTAPRLLATTLSTSCYSNMFSGCTSLTTAPSLPATSLTSSCYFNMFSGCTSLTTAPTLSVTTLAGSCYGSMFNGCTSLTTPPALPATSLSSYCYSSMFSGCTSITTAPSLPATSLADNCYDSMFKNCISLAESPYLPVRELTSGCYQSMFSGCTSLENEPALPATSLAEYCYARMFENCTSLTNVTALEATSLSNYCCYRMFSGCTSLLRLVKLPATSLTYGCYQSMFYGCTNIKLSTTQTEEYTNSYRIPTSGTGTVGTSSLDDMFYGTGGTFTGTPSINTTYYVQSEPL